LRHKTNNHKNVYVRSLKNYNIEKFSKALQDAKFPNYDIFSNVDIAYNDLLKRLSSAIESVAPLREVRIKNNSEDWFDGELHDKIKERDQLFQKFQKSKLQRDENLYKISKNSVQSLVKFK